MLSHETLAVTVYSLTRGSKSFIDNGDGGKGRGELSKHLQKRHKPFYRAKSQPKEKVSLILADYGSFYGFKDVSSFLTTL